MSSISVGVATGFVEIVSSDGSIGSGPDDNRYRSTAIAGMSASGNSWNHGRSFESSSCQPTPQ